MNQSENGVILGVGQTITELDNGFFDNMNVGSEVCFKITKEEGDSIFRYLLSRPIASLDTIRPLISLLQDLKPIDPNVEKITRKTLFRLTNSDGESLKNYLEKQPHREVDRFIRTLDDLPVWEK